MHFDGRLRVSVCEIIFQQVANFIFILFFPFQKAKTSINLVWQTKIDDFCIS